MKALLVVSCNDSSKWYSHKIGQVVPLLAIEETEYKSREDAGFTNFISKCDATVIDYDTTDAIS